MHAPCAKYGGIGSAASPGNVTLPSVQCGTIASVTFDPPRDPTFNGPIVS